ncbi:MAG TPA: hypothetical protein VI197_04160 [Polyangiaceae bacterium]
MDPVTGGTTLGVPSVTGPDSTATTGPATSSTSSNTATGMGDSVGGTGGTGGAGASSGDGGSGGATGTGGGGDASSAEGTGGSGGSSHQAVGGASGGTTATASTTSGAASTTSGAASTTGSAASTTGSASSAGGASDGSGGGGGTEAFGGAGGALGGAGGASSCGFEQRPNTVYFALDRSSSMGDDDFWDPVKEGLLDTVAAMQGRMRFGFAAFTGQAGSTCPLDLTAATSVKLDNLAGITSVLDPLEPPDPEGVKGETPTAAAVAAVRAELALDPSPGDVYVLLITDGDPDFCDDAEPACPSDALVYELQSAYLEGIETRVFNIAGGAATAARLGTFARAGRGLSVRGNSPNIHNTCRTDATWAAKLSALGRGAGQSLGSYVMGAPAGSYVTLDPSDSAALSATLTNEAAALLSCFFDLEGGTLGEGEESAVSVELAGQPLAYGDADGWTLYQGTLLELTGEACATYRSAAAPTLRIDVECDVLE